jgi:hypothetical protein
VGSEVQVLPGPPVIARFFLASLQGDIAQLVEHLLCKQGVTGSNPVVSIITGSPKADALAKRVGGDDPPEGFNQQVRLKHLYCVERSQDRGVFVPARNRLVRVNRRSVGVFCCSAVILFFVRVNQVLVRLWARVIGSVRCGVVVSDNWPLATDR